MQWFVGAKDSMESSSLWVRLLSTLAMCQLPGTSVGSFYTISFSALDKENTTSTTNPQQPTHPHVDIYLQDLLDNTQTVYFTYDEDKAVSEQSQGPGMLTTYKHGPQASQCLINVKGFLALFSHRRDCYDEVRHSTSSMTRVRMTITVYDKDKHNIKLEF